MIDIDFSKEIDLLRVELKISYVIQAEDIEKISKK